MPGYVGFANLPNQVHRKSVKKGFEFTLMVVGELDCCCARVIFKTSTSFPSAGETGLGKSTLVNSLFLTDLYPERIIPAANDRVKQTVKIDASTVEIEERGVKLRLTVSRVGLFIQEKIIQFVIVNQVVDTPGFGDALDNTDWYTNRFI